MAPLSKKIDEQALQALTQDLEAQLTQKNSIKSYSKLKDTQQILLDLFSDETYADHTSKVWLEATQKAMQAVIKAREDKWGNMPQYISAMKKDLAVVEYRLAHLEKMDATDIFELTKDASWNGVLKFDDIFVKDAQDITRHGVQLHTAWMKLGDKDVIVKWNGDTRELSVWDVIECEADGQKFSLIVIADAIEVTPASILSWKELKLTLTGEYGKDEWGKVIWRVGQEKNLTIKASEEDQQAFREAEDREVFQSIQDIDAVQNISTWVIDEFMQNSDVVVKLANEVFLTNDNTKLYWKYLDDAQKKLFIDDLVRSHPWFAVWTLVKHDDAKSRFFTSLIRFKNASSTPKTKAEMEDAFVGYHKNNDLKVYVNDALQLLLKDMISATTDETVKNNLATFYKKYSNKQVGEFDLFYNKLENDQTGAFTKIKEAFETVKQDSMFESFKDAMSKNSHIQAEKINGEWVWGNIPWDQQKRFSMQMVFQNPQDVTYPTRNRIQYIPALHADNILSLEKFLETFKDEIAVLAKNETDPTKLRWNIKTLILGKLSDNAVKDVLKKQLLDTFGDKISQNISWGSTNILNEMNKFAIDAGAYQPGYKRYIDENLNPTWTTPTWNTPTETTPETLVAPDDFALNEYEEGQELTMNAAISDVSRVYEDQAEHAGEEALRKEYEALWKFNLLKGNTYTTMFKRMKLYFFREDVKTKVKKEELEKYQTNGVDMHRSELTAAADRHQRMYESFNDEQHDKDKIEAVISKVNDPKVDELCREYLNSSTGMADRTFEDRFNTIIANNPSISKSLWWKDMKHTASNILLKLRTERAYTTMMNGMLLALEQYASNNNADAYKTKVKELVTTYVNLTQRALSPNLQKALNAPGDQVDKYRRFMRHEIGMAQMQANTLKIKLDVLKKGKWAFEVNNRDKNKNLVSKLWTWIRKHPKMALWLSIWSTLWVWIFAGWAAATTWALIKSATWMVSRKMWDYTEEQKGQEKKLTRELDQEKNRLTNLKGFINKASFREKAKNYRTFRQWRLYANTTQFAFMNDAKKDVENIRKYMLALDKPKLQEATTDALARIDYYVKSGHNFLGQQDDKQMEETMNDLQKLAMSGAETLGKTVVDMRTDAWYARTRASLDTNYTEMRKKFKWQRRWTGAKYGAAALALSRWMRSVLGNNVHHNSHDGATAPGTTPTDPVTTPTNPGTTPTNPVTPPTTINNPVFDHSRHAFNHDLYDNKSFGMKPSIILDHCKHINVLDPDLSKDVIAHMTAIGELSPSDATNTLVAIDKMITSHIPPSPDMQDNVANYLYHFAERDTVLSKVIGWWGDAGKDAIKDIIKDWGSGQKWLIDSFLAGSETFGRYLMNIASVASPMFANTFLENTLAPDKNGKKPGEPGYIPTVVDPNKPAVPGGFTNQDALNWIVRKNTNPTTPVNNPVVNNTPTGNTPTGNTPTNPPTNNNTGGNWWNNNPPNNTPPINTGWNNTPPPPPAANNSAQVAIIEPVVEPVVWPTEEEIQAELEETQRNDFVETMVAAIQPLKKSFQEYVATYNEIKGEFDTAKSELDLPKKIRLLQAVKARSVVLQTSLNNVKEVANNKYNEFTNKLNDLPDPVKAKVNLKAITSLQNKTTNILAELAWFITSIEKAINDVWNGSWGAATVPPTNNNPVAGNPTNTGNAKTQPAPAKKVTSNTNTGTTTAKKNINTPKPTKVDDILASITPPDKTLDPVAYRSAVAEWLQNFTKVVDILQDRSTPSQEEITSMKERIESNLIVHRDRLQEVTDGKKYFTQKSNKLSQSLNTYINNIVLDETLPENKILVEKKNTLLTASKNIADAAITMQNDLDLIVNESKKTKVLEILETIKTPTTTNKDKYHQSVEWGFNKYLKVMGILEREQKSLEARLVVLQEQVAWGKMVEKSTLDAFIASQEELREKSNDFADSLASFDKEVKTNLDQDNHAYKHISRKRDEVWTRNDNSANQEESMDKDVEKLLSDNEKLAKPAIKKTWNTKQAAVNKVPAPNGPTITTTTTTTVNNDPTSATPAIAPVVTTNTVVTVSTITDDSILAEFNALKWDKILRVKKKGQSELFNAYKAILEKNPDMYNANINKNEIAINWILDKSIWVWQAPTA